MDSLCNSQEIIIPVRKLGAPPPPEAEWVLILPKKGRAHPPEIRTIRLWYCHASERWHPDLSGFRIESGM